MYGISAKIPGKALLYGISAKISGKALLYGISAKIPGKALLYGISAKIPGKALLYGMSEIPGDILQPFVTLVMPVDKGHLYKFVQTDKEINPHRRKLQQKGADKAQWNC